MLVAVTIGSVLSTTQTPQVPIPTSFFGMHLHDVNSPWPDAPVGALAKGSETAWVYIEPESASERNAQISTGLPDGWVAMAVARKVTLLEQYVRTAMGCVGSLHMYLHTRERTSK